MENLSKTPSKFHLTNKFNNTQHYFDDCFRQIIDIVYQFLKFKYNPGKRINPLNELVPKGYQQLFRTSVKKSEKTSHCAINLDVYRLIFQLQLHDFQQFLVALKQRSVHASTRRSVHSVFLLIGTRDEYIPCNVLFVF